MLGYRQAGKSLAGELAFYPKAAYNDGWDHVCIADTEKRANYLHQRVQLTHKRWPAHVRQKQQVSSEVRQLHFVNDGQMRVMSGHGEAVGIGQSPDSFHGSECAYWKDAGAQFSLINPSMINRRRALMMLECTPAPLSAPSARWWRDRCLSAKKGHGRDLYAFFPYWDGKLNVREWPKGAKLHAEEEKMLETYGPKGLRLEHLAFRRLMFETDEEIRRNYDLFNVYYPPDDLCCWLQTNKGIIPYRCVEKHADVTKLVPWPEHCDYVVEYRQPVPGASYAIYVDPAGHGHRDHAAFLIFELWHDCQKQVGSYGCVTDPAAFTVILDRVGRKYNNAMIVTERNGVGTACAVGLQLMNYPNIYYGADNKPGVWKSNHDEYVNLLIDGLLDDFELVDYDLVQQLIGYEGDKLVQLSGRAEILGQSLNGRREKHHWDKVSALMVGAVVRQSVSRRRRPDDLPQNVVPFSMMSWNALQAYDAEVARQKARRDNGTRRTPRYTSTRKGRR